MCLPIFTTMDHIGTKSASAMAPVHAVVPPGQAGH
jgi:hypothetical protein